MALYKSETEEYNEMFNAAPVNAVNSAARRTIASLPSFLYAATLSVNPVYFWICVGDGLGLIVTLGDGVGSSSAEDDDEVRPEIK